MPQTIDVQSSKMRGHIDSGVWGVHKRQVNNHHAEAEESYSEHGSSHEL